IVCCTNGQSGQIRSGGSTYIRSSFAYLYAQLMYKIQIIQCLQQQESITATDKDCFCFLNGLFLVLKLMQSGNFYIFIIESFLNFGCIRIKRYSGWSGKGNKQ